MKNIFQLLITSIALMTVINCGGGGGSISTSSTSDSFDDGNLNYNPKMDILWVVDPSKSMFEEVEKVRNNISVFLERFVEEGYEYRIGVISTSAWSRLAYEANPTANAFLAKDGVPVFGTLHKGQCSDLAFANTTFSSTLAFLDESEVSVGDTLNKFRRMFDVYGVDANTSGCGIEGPPFGNYPSIDNNFFSDANGYNANLRTPFTGYINDERPLQSLDAFLQSSDGQAFVREDAHLAVIIISDEPDASRDDLTPSVAFIPGAEGNHTAQQYVDMLTELKGDASKFSVYSIVDEAQTENISRDIAELSGGISFDINASQSEYVANLSEMGAAILVSSSFFPIANQPIPSTIEITIRKANGEVVTVPSNGFTYVSAQQGVTLTADFLPSIGDAIIINYVPRFLIPGTSDQPRLNMSNTVIQENSPVGTAVGTVSLLFRSATNGVYSLVDNTDDVFEIDSASGLVTLKTSVLNSEVKGRYQISALLTIPGTVTADDPTPADITYTRQFMISISDVADSIPVAGAYSATVSESVAEPIGGVSTIRLQGNLSYNSSGLDSSEDHTYALVAQPSVGTVSWISTSAGTFTYSVPVSAIASGLANGNVNITFTYRITGTEDINSATLQSNTATVTLTVTPFNLPPVLLSAIPDQNVEFSGGLVQIPVVAGDIQVTGPSGDIANMLDNNNSTFLGTVSASAAHSVKVDFPSGKLYEVDRMEIVGHSSHSFGNSIFQVLAQTTGDVITREVLPVTAGSTLTVNMGAKVIGSGIRVLRPIGAINSQGHANLRVAEIKIFGTEAEGFEVPLSTYFSDPDGDDITYFATDKFGEGAAPAWVSIAGINDDILTGVPPTGSHTIGILARDPSGATAFTTFTVTRIGSGSGANNSAPISLLKLDDAKRGGITLRRFGGGSEVGNNPQTDNAIRHGEGDNFIVNPYAGQDIRDSFTGQSVVNLSTNGSNNSINYRIINNIPLSIRESLIANGHSDQLAHFGDNYGTENGWSITPTHLDEKYPQGSGSFCTQSAAANGRINPCINPTRSYGETYTGYFVPAKTGVYRFRSSTPVDDIVRLLMAPTEYVEDLAPVITSNHTGVNDLTASLYNILGDARVANQEFSPNAHPAAGHDTSIFYEGSVTANQGSYRKGYAYLKQGNVYAFEIRFQEGGGDVRFAFEYDRKDIDCNPTNNVTTSPGACWDGWAAIDAAVLVPQEGTDAHSPQLISAPSNVVNFDVKTLFYDAEQDTLVYTATLVNPDGSAAGNIGSIGLTLDSLSGELTGTLNQTYIDAVAKPRILFTATEAYTANQAATSSLPIKFDND